MTKLKNTKKGMAKKALSISLVAAMLATSNVPVWAAEFTDGEVAAFTSEVEAPVVEEAETAVELEKAATTVTVKGLEGAYVNCAKNIELSAGKGDGTNEYSLNYIISDAPIEIKKGDSHQANLGEESGVNWTDDNIAIATMPLQTTVASLGKDYIGKYLTAALYKKVDDEWICETTNNTSYLIIGNEDTDYYTANVSVEEASSINVGERLASFTGKVTTKNESRITTQLAWYGPDGKKVTANKDEFLYATEEGVYELKAVVTAPGYGDIVVTFATTVAGDFINSDSITGSVSIKNDSENQWGYDAVAEYSAEVPEGVGLSFRWETYDESAKEWTTVATTTNSADLTDSYSMKKADCGKKLRVVAVFVNKANQQTIKEVESNSFTVAPLQIAADDITYGDDPNFDLNDVEDETPAVDWVNVYKKDVIKSTKLTKTEYELVTQNTNKPGIRTVTIKLKGAYAGELTKTVNIGEYDLSTCKVTLENYFVPFVGDGQYAAPVIKEVKWANRVTLVEGEDYVVDKASLKSCVNAGKHTLTLEGRGDFTGTELDVEFEIVARSMENCKVVWTGKPVVKGDKLVAGVNVKDSENTHFVVVDNKGYILIPDKDYTWDRDGIYDVSQQKCKAVITAKGATEDKTNSVYRGGNYYGNTESDYVTVGTNLEVELTNYVNSVVSAQNYTGKAITFPALNKITASAVKKANGGKASFTDALEVGVDFDITYLNNTNAYLLKDKDGKLLELTRDSGMDEKGIYHYAQNQTDVAEPNDDPQAPQVFITLKGKYSGKTTPVRFAINQVNLATVELDGDVIFNPTATDANAMTAYAPQVNALQLKHKIDALSIVNVLKDTTDYTFDYYYVNDTDDVTTENGVFQYEATAHNSKVMNGSTRISVYDGNYYGTNAATVSVDAKSITSKEITVADIDNQKYNGKLIEPKVTVKDGAYTLVEDTDYTLTYKNNRSAGTATVYINGKTTAGRYTDVISKTFVIENKSISDAKIMKKGSYNSSYTDLSKYKATDYVLTSSLYNNDRPVAAEFDVVDANNNLLREGYDYTVQYKDNTKVGTATIVVTGKGDYEGTLEGTFDILGKGISGHFVEESIPAQTYTGSAIEPKVTFVPDTPNLELGKDYEITYEYNVTPGKGDETDINNIGPKVVAHGIGQYAGYVKLGFEIKKADITVSNVTAEPAVYAGGMVAEAKITVTNPASGAALVEGTDYTVEYVSGKNVGETGKANIHLVNNKCYTFNNDDSDNATIVVTYDIVAKDLKDITVEQVADQTYTGEQITPNLVVKNGSVVLNAGADYQVAYGENKEIGVGTATITPADGNKNYTGSKEVTFNIVPEKELVGKAMISEVNVKGNMATVVLDGAVDNAIGYDYVISTENDYKNGRLPNGINKNQLITTTNYRYLPEGTYYAYCHAYKRGEDGKKVFGAWSNIFKFEVTATTPATPKVTSVKVSGSTVTVTYTNCKDATGYDVVLGKNAKRVYNEMRPTNYGSYVAKAYKNGTVKVTFKNVAKGTYYAGLHAYNRTSEDGKKVFSPWSNIKKITVK